MDNFSPSQAKSDTGYFVYANGLKDRPGFHGKLEFDIQIIPYKGDASWVEQAFIDAHQCLFVDIIHYHHPAEACE